MAPASRPSSKPSPAPCRSPRAGAQNLVIGYFAQHQLEQLDGGATPLATLARQDPAAREQELRDFLGGFDFRGDAVNAPIAQFSGGEKARLVLATIVRARPDLLILDEPTNHLDIEMREALTEALQDYDGALVVVAHDRHLLAATADELWLVDGGRVAPFPGDLDDYRDYVLSARGRTAPESRARAGSGARRQQKRDARKPLVAEQSALEVEIETMTAEKRELDAWLAGGDAYADEARERMVAAVARQGELTWQLARAESAWLELQEKLDALDARTE
jgi:ATP-binding cassette subfamily F protein 3